METKTVGMSYAGFGRRLWASILDGVILSAVINLLLLPLGHSTSVETTIQTIVIIVLPLLYYVIAWKNFDGQTIGKRLVGVKVIKIDGSPMTYKTALIRSASYYLSAIVFFLGYIWIIFDKRKQGWHDKIAGTVVIKVEQPSRNSLYVWVIVAFLTIITIVVYQFISTFSPLFSGGGLSQMTNETHESILNSLPLTYRVYDGSGDINSKQAFPDNILTPKLENLSSGTSEIGENGVDTGGWNINLLPNGFSINKKSVVYIKLITDTEADAFIFKDSDVNKFLNLPAPGEDWDFSKKQEIADFKPLLEIKDSYSTTTLEAGDYQLVVIPTKKAIKIEYDIKAK